jgi:hypothetical protein
MDGGAMKVEWKFGGWATFFIAIGVLLLGVVAILAVIWWSFEARFHQVPKPQPFPVAQSRAEGIRQDLEYFDQLMSLDRSFSPAAKAAFEQERRQLVESAANLSDGQLEMGLSHAVALAGNGHTLVGGRSRRIARLPIRLAWFDEGLYVVRATQANAALLGSRVTGVGGKKPEDMLPVLTPYLSGTSDHAKASSSVLFEMPMMLAAIWPELDSKSEKLSLMAPDGRASDIELTAVAPDPNVEPLDLERNIAPAHAPGEPEDWRALLKDGPELPLLLQNPDDSVLARQIDSGKGFYIGVRKIDDDSKGSLSDQLDAATRDIAPGSLRYAILDLRNDGGGNYTKTLGFTKQLPKRLAADGKLIILTNNETFSAAIVTVARAKYFAGSRAIIVGEHVGDREQFWAESAAPLVLPNSKIRMYYATGYHDWEKGCPDFNRCFWPNVLLDVPAGSLAPVVTVGWRFSDYAAYKDTAFEEALKLARASGRTTSVQGGAAVAAPRALTRAAL